MKKSVAVTILAATLFGCASQPQPQHEFDAGHVLQGIQASATVRTEISVYYMERGQFPASNRELGLPEPGKFSGHPLTALEVSEGGVMTLTYGERSGVKNGVVQLIPAWSPHQGILWQCVTPSYPGLLEAAPDCEYAP
ncbi:pilin [Marinimicrobium sp. ABcell2]|uniref:pilin n=1 Tax=Marinimicrobium sp. ABcell2 TaxID=3069751 RepID=UPI0027B81CF7|nr:pilin [Marinimicrobium sp. ABcell2]MDQ2077075.1 pilin [Marinimicrobium sp. ABcell2]